MLKNYGISLLLLGSIAFGSLIGHFSPMSATWLGGQMDFTVLTLVTVLFMGVPLTALTSIRQHGRFIRLVLLLNFIAVPLLGYGLAAALQALPIQIDPLLLVGLMIYFMAPCTDWFLGFARMARGNVALGAALIPVQMVLQLLLYPVYLHIFTRHITTIQTDLLASTLLQWFVIPLLVAIALRLLLQWLVPQRLCNRILPALEQATPWLIAALVLEVFASHIGTLLAHAPAFGWLLLGVFSFFILTFWLGEVASRHAHLHAPEHALLTMTIAARNAPLMLALTVAALPDQPLVHAAIIIGMLLEFPHLTLLRHLLLQHRPDTTTSSTGLEMVK